MRDVAELTKDQKDLIKLRIANKRSIAEIAKELGCPSIWVVWEIKENENEL